MTRAVAVAAAFVLSWLVAVVVAREAWDIVRYVVPGGVGVA